MSLRQVSVTKCAGTFLIVRGNHVDAIIRRKEFTIAMVGFCKESEKFLVSWVDRYLLRKKFFIYLIYVRFM